MAQAAEPVSATPPTALDQSSSSWWVSTRDTFKDHEQIALVVRPDYAEPDDVRNVNPNLEIILPDSDSEEEQQVLPTSGRARRQHQRQRKRKKRKSKKQKQSEEVEVRIPSPVPPSFPSSAYTYDMSSCTVGELAPRDQLFCPLPALTKYPYKFVRGPESDRVSKAYFADGKFRARGWTVFYIYTLLPSATKPLIVVPAAEVEEFLFEINSKLNLKLGFPHASIEPGFLMSFSIEGSPRPRYLGRLTTENDLDTMESKILGPNFKQDGEPALDPRSFPAFRVKMEAAIQAGKNRSKASKEKKKKERIIVKGSWCDQLKRARCYLAFKPRCSTLTNPHSIPNLTWEEEMKAVENDNIARASRVRNIDVTKPVPHPFHENVIFISIDVESYERDRAAITEIGVSTLDTNDLANIPPGEGGVAWMRKIRSRHFRIKEYSHLVNSDFISGCADKFEKDFGTSEWISIKEVPQVIASCFKYPYSAPGHVDHLADNDNNETGQTPSPSSGASSLPDHTASNRNIILVGHDLKADIQYLRSIGYDVTNVSSILEAIDTADIYRALKHEHQPRSLGSVLLDLELVGWNLHNAGNDAAYTLQSMIGICLKSRRSREEMAKERDARMEYAAKEVKEQVKQDGQEWSEADNDEGDGGGPVQLIRQDPAMNPRHEGSKVNQTERLAREKIESNKRKEQKQAAKVASGHDNTRNSKDERAEWADRVVQASDVVGTEPGSATTAAVEGWVPEVTGRQAVSSADGVTKSTDGLAKLDDGGRTLPDDQEPANSASQGFVASNNERLKPSNGVPAPADHAIINPGFGFDGTQQMSAKETKHGGPTQAAETSNPLQSSTTDGANDKIPPIPQSLLDRLALLEAMDEEEGGVRL